MIPGGLEDIRIVHPLSGIPSIALTDTENQEVAFDVYLGRHPQLVAPKPRE